MKSVIIEIHAAEGGDHAKRLQKRQASIYENYARREGFAFSIIEDSL